MNRRPITFYILATLAIVAATQLGLSAEPDAGPDETVMLKAQVKMYKANLASKATFTLTHNH